MKVYYIAIKDTDSESGIDMKVDCKKGDVFTLTKTADGKTVHICDVEVVHD